MDNITKETTEEIFKIILRREFIPEVDAASALYVANILEKYAQSSLKDDIIKSEILLDFANYAMPNNYTQLALNNIVKSFLEIQ